MTITNQRMTIEAITPEQATLLLADQVGNRKINKLRVMIYARLIRTGRWEQNGVPIQLGHLPDGRCRLLDGQTRLNAIIDASMPALMTMIERDCTEEDAHRLFSTYDVGKLRTPSDLVHVSTQLGYDGIAEAHVVAGLAAFAIVEILEAEGPRVYNLFSAPERRELLEDGIHDILWAANVRRFYKGVGEKTVPVGVLGAAIAAHRASPEAAIHFFHSVFAGEGLFDGEPGYLLRKELIQNRPDAKGVVPTHHWWYCLTVKTWNMHAKGVTNRTTIRTGLSGMGWNPPVLPMRAAYDRAAD